MIDLKLLRNELATVTALLQKKATDFPINSLVELDATVLALKQRVEDLRKQKNELASKGAGGITDELREQSIALGKELKQVATELETKEGEFKSLYLSCPNIPAPDLPVGGKEANKPVRVVGEPPTFSFEPLNHLQLNEKLKWFDFDAGANLAGSGFVVYRGESVKLLYALTQMMLRNNAAHGFEPILPPYLVKEQVLVNSGNLPKFAGDFYTITEDGLCLIPTAEVSLTSLHAGQILEDDAMPKRYSAWTSCFRREAGSHGALDRGLIRIHQFEKVELYSIVKPEASEAEQELMLKCAEKLLQDLGLHYRVSLLATQDCSFSSARTFDIEVWMPGQGAFYEVSSVSNCTDFQARRAGIRYRSETGKPRLVHTLNASSLALPRLMVALMEQGQDSGGEIRLPEAVVTVMSGLW